jgi:tRNA(Ile)-lysidine synthase
MAAECVKPKGEHFSVSLLAFPSSTKNTWLYHAIWPFGFNRTQCNDLLAATEGGKRIESETHIAVISKTVVDILSKTAHSLEELHVPALGKYVVGGSTLDASMTTEVPASFSGDNFHVYLDADFVNVPLTLRAAQPTDQFQPLGLEYHVNVLDYLREKGQSPSAILQTYVCVTSENRIAWLVGTQIAHWCALRSSTSSILSLSFGRHDH